MAGLFTDVFGHLQTSGLQETITSFGGCFSFRSQRIGTKLSAHSWGIAIDLNPETNAQGTSGNMHPAVVGAFVTQASNGVATGREERAIPCTFSFARGIDQGLCDIRHSLLLTVSYTFTLVILSEVEGPYVHYETQLLRVHSRELVRNSIRRFHGVSSSPSFPA